MSTHPGEGAQADSPGLRELVEAHVQTIRLIVRRRMGRAARQQESESDLVNSICADLLKSGVEFDYRGIPQFHDWLRTVVQHKLHARVRQRQAQKRDARRMTELTPSQYEACGAADQSPPELVGMKEDHALLHRALSMLSPMDRELVSRRHLQGQSRHQIALELCLPPPVLNNRIARAKARLAAILDRLTPDRP